MGSADSKAAASYQAKTSVPVQVERAREGYYESDDHDGYKSMRVGGDATMYALDSKLLAAIQKSLVDDGKVDVREVQEHILPRLKEGAMGTGLTCNQRWTIRFCLGEVSFDEAARRFIFEAMWDMNEVYDCSGKLLEDEDQRHSTITGPDFGELGQKPAKRVKGSADTVEVDGMLLSRPMLVACKSGLTDDGILDALEAVKIFSAAAEDGRMDRTERWTLRFLLSAHSFTNAAFDFITEALSKLPEEEAQEEPVKTSSFMQKIAEKIGLS